MKLIFRYMKPYAKVIAFGMFVKLLGTMTELLLPYILEHIIDVSVPTGDLGVIFAWGALLIATALVNILACFHYYLAGRHIKHDTAHVQP